MLDLVGSAFGLAVIVVDAIAILLVLPLTLRQRLAAGAAIGAWVGIASALGATGALAYSPGQPVPVIGLLFAAPLLAALAATLLSARVRSALLSIPTELLVGLNAFRVIGAIFLALAAVGRLSGPFPFSAGLGDIITGIAAVFLYRRIVRGEPAPLGLWNAFGALDLVLAVGFGLTTAPGNLQLFHVGVGSAAMQHLPFSLVPTVLVPFYLTTHAIIAAQLAARRQVGVFAAA